MRRLRKDVVVKYVLLLAFAFLCICSFQVLKSYLIVREEKLNQGVSSTTAEMNITVLVAETPEISSSTIPLVSYVTCPGLSTPQPLKSPGFQMVKGSDSFVYAAHLQEDYVTVIALVRDRPRKESDQLYCQIWHSDNQQQDPLIVVDAEVEVMQESHGRRYAAAFIKCPLPDTLQGKPAVVAVNIVGGYKCRSSGSRLTPLSVTHEPPSTDQLTSEFTVCVSPVNLRYSRAYELVEMVEFNKILGADNFVFYNFSMGPNVDHVLRRYIKSGDVNVLPWHLPLRTDTWPPGKQESEVWYFGQLAALNDCLLRYRHKAHYIVFSDLDEFIVPLKDPNWAQLLTRLRKPPTESSNNRVLQRPNRKTRDIFIFRCAIFRKEWPQPVLEFEGASSKLKSAVLGYTLREAEILPAGSRSKMIVNPRLVQEVGIHLVWKGEASLVVPHSLGLLYHYRSWERPDQKIDLTTSKEVALRFGDRLIAKMQAAWDSLPGVSSDIDIKSYGSSVA